MSTKYPARTKKSVAVMYKFIQTKWLCARCAAKYRLDKLIGVKELKRNESVCDECGREVF